MRTLLKMQECLITIKHYPSGGRAPIKYNTNNPDKAMELLRRATGKSMEGFTGGIIRGMLMSTGESDFETETGTVVKAHTQVVCMN